MENENMFLYTKDDFIKERRNFFYGYAFNEDSIIFANGFDEYLSKNKTIDLESLEGRFCLVYSGKDNKTIVKTDKTGQELSLIHI